MEYSNGNKLRMEEMRAQKYHRIVARTNSQVQANNVMKTILMNAELQVFSRTFMHSYKNQMARQIVTAQSESIQQIRSSSPDPPFVVYEDQKPIKGAFDTIRPYSAKVQRVRKIESACRAKESPAKSKRTSLARNIQSAKTLRSTANIKPRQEHRRELSKYKSKLIPLSNNTEEDEQCDKIIQQLRRNKLKAEQYERSKQNFLSSISKQNQEYTKRKCKFASTMTRKDYTYSYNCQILQIPKVKPQIKKKSATYKNTINQIGKRSQNQQAEKSQVITVQFTKREPRAELKQYVFNTNGEIKPESICPPNSYSTKYTVMVEDC